MYIDSVLANIKEKNHDQPEFIQAAQEVLDSLRPVIEKHPHLIRSRYQGPDGWNDSILTLLQENA